MSTNPWTSGILLRKFIELIGVAALNAACTNLNPDGDTPPHPCGAGSIAFDASFTHMYAPGTQRHIKSALAAGATMEEIMVVPKPCLVRASNLATSVFRFSRRNWPARNRKGSKRVHR
ncbi:MAG TPA: hypothetical protein VFS35_06840 [Terrimicrobiaceae bacterium]|nr:hypothetical protein [Terrimicrobiaceae bacterium]